ncbi:MAG: FHA domain-containing protein [Planctomycetota bacterium]
MIQLVYIQDGMEHRVEVREGVIVLGRAEECSPRLRHPSVALQHLEITRSGHTLSCRDLGSGAGTTLNGQLVVSAPLHQGDSLMLGEMAIRIDAYPSAPAPSKPGRAGADTPPFLETIPEPAKQPSMPRQLSPRRAPPQEGSLVPQIELAAGEAVTEVLPRGAMFQARRRRRSLYALIAVLGAAFLAAILWLSFPRRELPAPLYAKADYWKDVRDGMDLFKKKEYGRAVESWKAAQAAWEKDHPEESGYMVAAAKFARITAPLAEAESIQTFEDVEWQDILQETRLFLDEVSAPEDVEAFVQDFRTQSSRAAGELSTLREAVELNKKGQYAAALEKAELIRADGYYGLDSQNLAREIRRTEFKERKAALYARLKKSDVAWAEVVREGQAVLKLDKDEAMQKDLVAWKLNADHQLILQEADRARQEGGIAKLRRAENLYRAIPQASLYYDEAQGRLKEIDAKMLQEMTLSLFTAGDTEGLRALARKNPAAAENPDYRKTLAGVERILEHFAAADKALETGDPLQARTHWDTVREIAASFDNAYNRQARFKLQEWSRERIGNDLILQGREAFRQGQYVRARRSFEKAKQCDINAQAEMDGLLKQSHDLFVAAQNDYNKGLLYEARQKALQARDCLLPNDASYAMIERFLRKVPQGETP